MATYTYTGDVKLVLTSQLVKAEGLPATTATEKVKGTAWTVDRPFTDGTGTNKAQMHWHNAVTVAATGSSTLNLTALPAGMFGTVSLSKIKTIIGELITPTSGAYLKVGGSSSTKGFAAPFGGSNDIVNIGASGVLAMANPVDGWTVAATSPDLKLENVGGAPVTAQFLIIGEGAVV